MKEPKNKFLDEVSKIKFPTLKYGILYVRGFKSNGDEALAIYKGNIIKAKNPFVRLHSQCLFGETFSSLRCDCHSQIIEALNMISKNPPGLIIYLFQEGRGAGLISKLKAIHLEDEGMDTVEAYHALHLPIDQREYELAARILEYLGINNVRLLTNNPRKLKALRDEGFKVTRVPIETKPTKYNLNYLKTKKDKMGHLFKNL